MTMTHGSPGSPARLCAAEARSVSNVSPAASPADHLRQGYGGPPWLQQRRKPDTTLRNRTRRDLPDLGGVLGNRSIAGESTRAGDVEDSHPCPLLLIGVRLTRSRLRRSVGRQI